MTIPTWAKLAALGLIVALIVGVLSLVRSHYIGIGEANVQTKWDDANAKRAASDAEAARRRDAAERAKEQSNQQEAERIANDQAQKQREQAAREQRADATVRSLRATIAQLNQQRGELPASGASAGAATSPDDASVARELLGSCAERYSAVAAAADQLRDQVGGLQSFVKNVCDAGQANAPSQP